MLIIELEALLKIVLESKELAIFTTSNSEILSTSITHILEIYLQIGLGEESIWIQLDALGQSTTELMIHRLLYGNWFMITPEFRSNNIFILYSNLVTSSPLLALLTLEAHNLSED